LTFTVDSNVLVYAVDRDSADKNDTSRRILKLGRDAGLVLTAQAIAEFLNVIRRKFPAALAQAQDEAKRWAQLFPVLPTRIEDVFSGTRMALAHKLQLWDSVIWQVARAGGASLFLTEDLQDGFTLEGVTVLDPFNASNRERLQELLGTDRE
jgi:predicted nucleic acid-binding protein